MNHLREYRNGYPNELVSDNGRQFVSDEFEHFLTENGIKHRKVIPYWPRANGLVEIFNKSLKKAVQSACLMKKNWKIEIYKFLLNYRTTPQCTTNVPPCELLFNRKVRSKLPSFDKGTAPDRLRKTDAKQKSVMKRNADKRAGKDYKRFRLGQKVLVLKRNPGKSAPKWENDCYTVVGQYGPRVKLKSQANQLFYRHTSHVRGLNEPD